MKSKVLWVTITLISLVLLPFTIYIFKYDLKELILTVKQQPENYTELYFNNHHKLPQIIEINSSNDFSFTIHNMEYKTVKYPYVIYVESELIKQEIESGEVTLKHNEFKSILESFHFIAPIEKARIVVELTSKKQQIHFWMESKNLKNEILTLSNKKI